MYMTSYKSIFCYPIKKSITFFALDINMWTNYVPHLYYVRVVLFAWLKPSIEMSWSRQMFPRLLKTWVVIKRKIYFVFRFYKNKRTQNHLFFLDDRFERIPEFMVLGPFHFKHHYYWYYLRKPSFICSLMNWLTLCTRLHSFSLWYILFHAKPIIWIKGFCNVPLKTS